MKTFKNAYETYLSEAERCVEINELDKKICEELRQFVPSYYLNKIDEAIAELCGLHEERAFKAAYFAGIREAIS